MFFFSYAYDHTLFQAEISPFMLSASVFYREHQTNFITIRLIRRRRYLIHYAVVHSSASLALALGQS